MENIILILIVGGIFYLIWKLSKIGYKLDDTTLGVDNPYYDNKVGGNKYRPNSMPLDKYEKELDKAFGDTFKEEKKPILDEIVYENMNVATDLDDESDEDDFNSTEFSIKDNKI